MNRTILNAATTKTVSTGTTMMSTTNTILKNAKTVTDEAVLLVNQTILAKDIIADEIHKCTEGPTELFEKEQLGWWAYIILVVIIFLILLLMNFIVKKINDARMEERCARLYRKSSTCTQVPTTLVKSDYYTKRMVDTTKNSTPTLTGISLIYSISDNEKISGSTSTSTALRIADCGEAFQKAKSLIDRIYEDSEFPLIIHRNSCTPDAVQSNDVIKEHPDINETKLASGDANATEVVTIDKEPSNTTLDTYKNNKSRAHLEFEAIRKKFEILGKTRPVKHFKINQTTTTINETKDIVKSKNICLKISSSDNVTNNEDNIIEIKGEDPSMKDMHITNEVTVNGLNPRGSEMEVKSKVSLAESKKNLEITKECNETKNDKYENT